MFKTVVVGDNNYTMLVKAKIVFMNGAFPLLMFCLDSCNVLKVGQRPCSIMEQRRCFGLKNRVATRLIEIIVEAASMLRLTGSESVHTCLRRWHISLLSKTVFTVRNNVPAKQ